MSQRDHLESIWKQTGHKPKELEEPCDLPECFIEVYQWFLSLNNKRQAGMSINPISYSDMQAFFNLMQLEPLPWEIQVISVLDSELMKIHQEQQEKEQALNKK